MNRSNDEIIASLDIGSYKIKCLIVKFSNNEIKILGRSSLPSKGIQRGLVVNYDEANIVIRKCIEIAEKQADLLLNKIIVGIDHEHIFNLKIEKFKTLDGNQIDHQKDTQPLIQSGIDEILKNYKDKSILHVFFNNFKIDKKINVDDPLNFKANFFSTEIHAVVVDQIILENLKSIINGCELSVERYVLGSFALGLCFFGKSDLKDLIFIDFGKDKISISIFENNTIVFNSVIPLGSNQISKDLAKILNLDLNTAEKIKVEFGNCYHKSKNERNNYLPTDLFPENNFRKISLDLINSIINSRVSEIIEMIYISIKSYNINYFKNKKIYLSGGGANLNGLKDYINIKLSSQAELLINKINHDLDLSSNLMSDFYICYGMIRHHIEGIPSEVLPSQNKSKGILSTILSIF
jgi:cell division protein FtsA